ncbi:MAG: tripartite tricarboxylate transporter substrate binding protein, partial [Betaproteobacteria bacterium]|nr:tripartite tricarboxylate transporter substrate binding protein [Betaproteobacteria bacterium]
LVNQFAPGASGDISSRIVAQSLAKVIGQPVVVENRAGGAGTVAAAYVAKSEPDGHTVLYATSGIVTNKFLAKSQEFDALEALLPISQISRPIVCLVVNAKFPAGTLKELIEYARRNPGKVAYGTSGIGSPHHFSGEQIKLLTGANLIHLPYKASAQALLDTVAGQIPATFSIYSVTVPQIQAGRVRVLAVVSEERVRLLPDVPTVAEIVPGFEEPPSWTGFFAPAKIQPALLKRLNADIVKAMSDPDLRAKLEAGGSEINVGTPEQFAETIRRGVVLTEKIVKSAGLKLR